MLFGYCQNKKDNGIIEKNVQVAKLGYEIERTDKNVVDVIKEYPYTKTPLFSIWNILCNSWNNEPIREFIKKIVSEEQAIAIEVKCSSID